ncbi:hypothetical protein JF540_21630 [Salipiger thiooxidans]|uniref:hypothetical protein n=1 Tax=Salipiger thiooxidans TaxID=282683 RepID=UPI001A8C7387|nr:hypothetical protein [Salipiger thiooxidans]MBN8189289.1 hypothetical protein [Salipiger thiooxidans]
MYTQHDVRPSRDAITDYINAALVELVMTEADLIARQKDASEAQRAATEALDAHNEAQKRVDELFEQLRDTRHGDWASRRMIPARLGRCCAEASE